MTTQEGASPPPDALDPLTSRHTGSSEHTLSSPPGPLDKYLPRRLKHQIPTQYLQHSTDDRLNLAEKREREKTDKHKEIKGVVVSAGLMDKTVRVRVPGERWNKKLAKVFHMDCSSHLSHANESQYFESYTQHLVHDPNNSLIVGDVIQLHRLRVSKRVHHVVGRITAPFGKPIQDRPPIPTPDERLAQYKKERFAKLERRALRRKAAMGDAEAIEQLRSMGLDPGKNVAPGKGEKAGVQEGVGKKRTPTSGAILGSKGQKLPEGVLPGGKHEVGKINERSKQNKESATKLNEQAEANLLEAKEKADELKEEGLSADGELPKKSSVGEAQTQ